MTIERSGATGSSRILAIINFNTRDELRQCLESLRPDLHRVIVFDNGSSDNSAEMVRSEFPEVLLMAARENIGYGTAANYVFLQADAARGAPVLILSNSDVIFPPGAVNALIDDLRQHPEAAIVGPRLLNPDGSLQRSCFPHPGGLRWLIDNDIFGALLRFVPGIRRAPLLRLWSHDSGRSVPWVKGAVLAIRRTAFEEVGGFDESFFLYYEETDLCYRLAKRGWRTRFTPHPELVHSGAASTSKLLKAMTVEQYVSSMRFARSHYSQLHSTLLLYLWKGILLQRVIRDRVRLAWISDTARCEHIRHQLQAWQVALTWNFEKIKPSRHA